MRKVILFINTTIDGFVARPDGGLDWMQWDDEQVDEYFTTDLRATADTILTGRKTYQSFESAWPARATDSSLPQHMYEFANWMIDTPIVVFTKTMDTFGLEQARRAESDIAAEVAALRAEPGKDMVIFGGADTARAFIAEGLIDEYWLKVHPAAIGTGLPIFTDIAEKGALTLTWSKVYDSGVIGLRYATKK